MQNNQSFRKFLDRNLYLLIIAAWLVTFAIIIDNYWSPNASIQTVQKKLTNNIQKAEKDFQKLVKDSEFISAANGNITEDVLTMIVDKDYGIFSYKTDSTGEYQLTLWNTQKILHLPFPLFLNNKSGFYKLNNGYYVWNSYTVHNMKILALIPVKSEYVITDKDLDNSFTDKTISNAYDVSLDSGSVAVQSIHGNQLFKVYQKSDEEPIKNNIIAVWLVIGAVMIFLFFIHLLATYISTRFGRWYGIAFLLAIQLFLLFIIYNYPFPFNFLQFYLFSPNLYGSSWLLPSLGHLLIDSLFFVWLILFTRVQLQDHKVIAEDNKKIRWFPLIMGSLIILGMGYAGSFTIRSLIADSQISFDVTDFFNITEYSVVSFIVLCCIAIGYYFLCQIVLHFLTPFLKNSVPLLLSIALLGLVILTMGLGMEDMITNFYILLWILFFILLLQNEKLYLLASQLISSRLVFWLFFFSLSISSIIILENTRKELNERKRAAEKLSDRSDPLRDKLLNSMLLGFKDEFLIKNFHRLYEGSKFTDSIVKNGPIGYIDRFNTYFYKFNLNKEPISNPDTTSYEKLNSLYTTIARPSSVPELSIYDNVYNRYGYITKKTLIDYNGDSLGYVFIQISLNEDKEHAIFPALFGRGEEDRIENSPKYAYAIYNNFKVIENRNEYSFPTALSPDFLKSESFYTNQTPTHSELWYNPGGGKGRFVVITKENNFALESITLFSYLFCAFLLLTFIFWIINVLLTARFHVKKVRLFVMLNIRNQIHGTIILVSLISFFVIGIATILFFIDKSESNNRYRLSNAIHIMENELTKSMAVVWQLPDSTGMTKNIPPEIIQPIIERVSDVHGMEINLYNLNGDLEASSFMYPYDKGIVSKKMNPRAFFYLNNSNYIQFFEKENIARLSYLSIYIPVINPDDGEKYAYLNIPYFTSETTLNDEISNFLVTIINLNAFTFIIAGIIALFITNRITRSFSLIASKMRLININRRNEAIVWERNDEIGELVNEYNKMVSKLEESAQALAKTERESAWREMAKQIAHEIKNPLTPMKLSMQYLQKSIEQNQPNIKDLTANVSKTLVEQIDHLSHIASEFSQFANIENAHKEVLDLNEELANVLNLYSTDKRLKLYNSLLPQPVIIEADKTHLNRIFNNLLQNALQASEKEQLVISVHEEIQDGQVVVSIRDNGSGIKEEFRDKIFTPNFTTKTSGTGLGLAMSKRMVEQAHGNIWFETKVGEGTTFFLAFPLYDPESLTSEVNS